MQVAAFYKWTGALELMCTAPLTGVAMITIMYQPLCIPSNRPKVLIYLRSKTGIIVEKSNGNLALPKDEKKGENSKRLMHHTYCGLALRWTYLLFENLFTPQGSHSNSLGLRKSLAKRTSGGHLTNPLSLTDCPESPLFWPREDPGRSFPEPGLP